MLIKLFLLFIFIINFVLIFQKKMRREDTRYASCVLSQLVKDGLVSPLAANLGKMAEVLGLSVPYKKKGSRKGELRGKSEGNSEGLR